MKRSMLLMLAVLLMVAGGYAQKIDQRLTGLVEKVNARRAQGLRPVDAPVYNMMGQRVDKNTRGFVIYKGRKYLNK